MRAFGARGFVSEAQLKKGNAFIAQCRKSKREQQRAQIAALSDTDIQIIMARKIVEITVSGRAIVRTDFHQAGIPEHRIDKNRDAAMRRARKQEPRLDAMMAQPCAA